MIDNSNKRIVGVDILKIISMLFIILQHLLFQGQIVQQYETKTIGWFLIQALYGTTFFAVNCYALASGFLCFKQKYKFSRIISIWLETLFYSLIIYVIFVLFKLYDFSFKEFVGYIVPIITGKYWYITAYFLMFLFIPFLNFAINTVNRATLKKVLICLFVFMSCGSLFYTIIFYTDPFGLNRGYSAMWLMVMYLFGAYIGKYEVYKSVKTRTVALVFTVLIFLAVVLRILLIITGLSRYSDAFLTYVSPVNCVLALLFFVICLKIEVKSLIKCKIFYVLSSTTIGVFLIHTHPLIRGILTPKLVVLTELNPFITVLLVLTCAVVIFGICSLIDLIRIKLFKLIKIDKCVKKIDIKLYKEQ